ncbi:MAG TPA: tetratricopeptide repeat protein [Terriglobales bacterium]|jgi:hypothetical protein
MRSSWKIAISVACIAVIAGASIVGWVRRKKAIEWKKSSEAASETRARAEEGDAKAQANLGSMYSHGQGVPQNYVEALRWYRRAADQGDPQGQDGLASMYYYGRGVPQDYAEALSWYRKSADGGYAKADNGIALMYSQGKGVPQDYAEALRWYRKAIDQGYAPAQYNLGKMYYYGRGVPRDRAESERWYQKAANQGDEYAQRILGLKGSGLSIFGTITLLAMFLWCLRTLKDALLRQPDSRDRQQPALTMAAVCGLAYIVLSVYVAFGSFRSVLAANAFHFFNNLVAGIGVAMCITVFGPKRTKVVLGISSILLIVTDVIVISLIMISQHDVMSSVTTSRGFSSVNGLSIGIAAPLAVFLWLESKKRTRDREAAG